MKKQHIISFIAIFVLSFVLSISVLELTSDKTNTSNNSSQIESEVVLEDKEESQIEQNSQEEQNSESAQDSQNEPTNQNQTNSEINNSESEKTETGNSNTENSSSGSEESVTPTSDPYEGMSKEKFYANYKPATSLQDALYRSKHGFLSGSLEMPGQYAIDAKYRPMENGKYIRNTSAYYLDGGNTYVVVDSKGNEVMRIYKGGGYITLEEVAAYMYAFGGSSDSIPANYTSKKSAALKHSLWGEYQRVNHSYFIGNTNKYPYEPELPNISGCGGELQYYEMDIGTTGTVTPGKSSGIYNNGTTITRGAARLVYARQDLNGNGVYEQDEVYVFYTHNHYNDFREYLNYYGGWGEMFGNITGGGVYDSKTECNPTPYVTTGYKAFLK